MNWKNVQTKLNAAGFDAGKVDGDPGPQTCGALLAYVANRPMNPTIAGLGVGLSLHLNRFDLTTPARVANFVGQGCHETGSFRYLREIWGPTAAQQRYEGRADLGNNQPGDGRRFLGRGVFQITGRANYEKIGERLDIDLITHPEQAEEPGTAILTALDFWQTHHLNDLADQGREDAITRTINGGTNGIDERRAFVARAKGVLT